MVYKIVSKSKEEYKKNLSRFITENIIIKKNKITFIDCMNSLSQYIFPREYVENIMDNLYFSRIELIYDLLDLLKQVQFNSYFKKSNVFLLSSYSSLLKDMHEKEIVYYKDQISKILIRIEEKYNKEVVVMEYNKKWATQYPLNV